MEDHASGGPRQSVAGCESAVSGRGVFRQCHPARVVINAAMSNNTIAER